MAAQKRSASAPAPALQLTSLRQVQALAHPLRFRAFEHLIDAPRTGKQLALALGKQPTHLYHHLGVLERAGLIRQVATRQKRGTTERYYRAVSERVVVDDRLLGGRVTAGQALVGPVLRATYEEFVASANVARPDRSPRLLKRLRIRTSAKRLAELVGELEDWLCAFEDADQAQAADPYAVTVALYPLAVAPAAEEGAPGGASGKQPPAAPRTPRRRQPGRRR
ncbi:MAG: ArsR/SmtB family transcription factor [Pirellulales bacterium]